MKNYGYSLLAICLFAHSSFVDAQRSDANPPSLNPQEIKKIGDIVEKSMSVGQAWQRVKDLAGPIYIDMRKKGEPRSVVLHNLQRIGLPGVDISEFGQAGQEIRQELSAIAKYAERKDGLSETAAMVATGLDFRSLLQKHVAIDVPKNIHMAIADDSGSAPTVHTEDLYKNNMRRSRIEFTKEVSPKTGISCTVDAMQLVSDVYFAIKCQSKGNDSVAISRGACAVNDDRMRPVTLNLKTSKSDHSHDVLVWCSNEPI